VTNSRQAYNPATSSSGASDASGASHWTNRNELIPNSSPVRTSPSAKCSADSMITIALNRKHATTHRRRVRVGNVPIQAAGPTRWGTAGGAWEMRQVYATKIPSSTHRSNRVTVRLNGRVREYSVASARNATSTDEDLGRVIPRRRVPSRRKRHSASRTNSGPPMPISARLDPVMLASTYEHAFSPSASQLVPPEAAMALPPLAANTKLTAYSGSTAIRASTAIASPAEMSSCATSAAHDRMNAAPTTARPKISAISSGA